MLGKLLVVKVSCLPTLGGSPRAGQGRKGRSLGMNVPSSTWGRFWFNGEEAGA